jgi:hypothetical protein
MLLLAVSQILREVGDVSEARKLAEEAYTSSKDVEKQRQAAVSRALMFKDLDDEILWLGRADPESIPVQASLNNARGHKAELDGKQDQAATHFRAAVDLYEKLPETAASLNNAALSLFSLYQVTREKDHFIRGMDKLDRAVALRPGDSILLHNAATILLEAAIRDTLSTADFRVLKRRASLDLLSFLYKDTATKKQVVEQFLRHHGAVKARGYFEKLIILSPKRDDAYLALFGFHDLTHDVDGLRALKERLDKVELDLAHEKQEVLDLYLGKTDPGKIEDMKKALERQKETLPEARRVGGATLAIAAATSVKTGLAASVFGLPADADNLVKLAEEAHSAAPSDGTASVLIQALSYRAHRALFVQNKAYAELAAQCQRSLSSLVLSHILGDDGPLCRKAMANADVKRALEIRLGQLKALPEDRGPLTWAAIRMRYPQDADHLAEQIKNGRAGELERAVQRKLSPLSGTVALDEYWALRVSDKKSEAAEAFKRFAAHGVPLPAVVP